MFLVSEGADVLDTVASCCTVQSTISSKHVIRSHNDDGDDDDDDDDTSQMHSNQRCQKYILDAIRIPLPNVLEDVNLDLCGIRVLADGSHNFDCNTCLPASVPAFEHLGKRALTHEFENFEPIRDVVSESENDVALFIVDTAISTMTVPPPPPPPPQPAVVVLRGATAREMPCAVSVVVPIGLIAVAVSCTSPPSSSPSAAAIIVIRSGEGRCIISARLSEFVTIIIRWKPT